MKKIIVGILLTLMLLETKILTLQNFTKLPQQAVIIEPVADLLGEPTKTKKNNTYQSLPLCGGSVEFYRSCPRLHQTLFNEIVEIVAEHNDEVQIKIPNLYFLTQKSETPHNTYWTLKSNLITFENLHEQKTDLTKFPPPISFQNAETNIPPNTIVLIVPWYDTVTRKTYSPGTRFVIAHAQPQKTLFVAYIFDKRSGIFQTAKIPRSSCVKILPDNPQDRITLFVSLLKKWANWEQGIIPYVWGGCSFITTHKKNKFTMVTKKNRSYAARPDDDHIPKTGFDCSGLITRAAQICGIPYFCKNTTTLERELTPLLPDETIQEGDLIKITGHVMIAADIKKNTLIEARGYADGFGKVQEIPLPQVFKGINTYDDLVDAYHQKKSLVRLASNGKDSELFKQCKIMKMESAWKHG